MNEETATKVRKVHFHNPIVSSEMKVRMRTWKTPIGMLIYLAGMMFFLMAALLTTSGSYYNGYNNISGTAAFLILANVQFFMVILIAPSTTAGAISSEREKQTFDLLLCTQMSPFKIIIGKLFASMSWVFLLLLVSLPVYAVTFLYGGVTPLAIILSLAYYILCAICCGCVGLFYSIVFKRTITSAVLSYLTIFFFGIITIVTAALEQYFSYYYNYSYREIPISFYLNPYMGYSGLTSLSLGQSDSFLGLFYSGSTGTSNILWVVLVNVIFMAGISILLFFLCSLMIDPTRTHRGKRKA